MEIVYLLKHVKTNKLYIGRTNNLKIRLSEHKADKRDYKLIAYFNLKKRINFSLLEFSEGGGRSETALVTV